MKKVFRILLNKYLLTAIAFIAWVGYFDQNDWITQQRKKQELQELKQNVVYLKAETAKMKAEKEAMENDPEALEQFARERYHMKRDNEDVYIFE